jgi:hypothetical protein
VIDAQKEDQADREDKQEVAIGYVSAQHASNETTGYKQGKIGQSEGDGQNEQVVPGDGGWCLL